MNKAVELLMAWDKCEQEYPDAQLAQFCRYYLAKEDKQETIIYSEGLLLKLMGSITSVFNIYHRATMSQTKQPSAESFYFLNGLAYLGEVKKTDLINYLFYEYTTGMEVISNLLNAKKKTFQLSRQTQK